MYSMHKNLTKTWPDRGQPFHEHLAAAKRTRCVATSFCCVAALVLKIPLAATARTWYHHILPASQESIHSRRLENLEVCWRIAFSLATGLLCTLADQIAYLRLRFAGHCFRLSVARQVYCLHCCRPHTVGSLRRRICCAAVLVCFVRSCVSCVCIAVVETKRQAFILA